MSWQRTIPVLSFDAAQVTTGNHRAVLVSLVNISVAEQQLTLYQLKSTFWYSTQLLAVYRLAMFH